MKERRLIGKRKLIGLAAAAAALGAAAFLAYGAAAKDAQAPEPAARRDGAPAAGMERQTGGAAENGRPIRQDVPPDGAFRTAAENGRLRLAVDEDSGHFRIEDKASGTVWRSYPNPAGWDAKASEQRRRAMLSPLHVRYVEPLIRSDQTTETNLLQEGGLVQVRAIPGGFEAAYALPSRGLSMAVSVVLREDAVEVSLPDAEWRDTAETQLVSAKAYPYFGAEASAEEEGYVLIPDGPGALIAFRSDRPQTPASYNGPIYGGDLAFGSDRAPSNRRPVTMPVFGIKKDSAAFLAVVTEGAEYASVFAAPSGSFNGYNWAAAEQLFRARYFQPTARDGSEGYYVYNERRFASERTVRYYLLTGGDADYSGMAAAYRSHLTEEHGLRRLQPDEGGVALHLRLLGGDRKPGFPVGAYVPLTTADEAKSILSHLHNLGVREMAVRYSGWQNEGFSRYGPTFPVASGLGGDDGMSSFVRFAHELGVPVFLEADAYAYNNTGAGGYRQSRDGLRDLGSSAVAVPLTKTGKPVPIVSPQVMSDAVNRDLEAAAELGADGFAFGGAAAASLHSDYNRRRAATRIEARQLQEELLRNTKEALGDVRVSGGNAYTLSAVSHLYDLADDYSYDLFVDEVVPFAQMALHGLIPYSFADMNARDDYREEYLRSIEYGAEPSFAVSYAPTRELLDTYGYKDAFSTHYEDWLQEMVGQYQSAVQALGAVKQSFMTRHRTLAPGVKETTYEGGRTIVVNYNDTPYRSGPLTVPAKDFAVTERGETGDEEAG